MNQNIMYCLLQLGKVLDNQSLRLLLDQFKAIVDKSPEDSTIALRTKLRLQSRLAQLEERVDLEAFLVALGHRETAIRWTGAKALLRACPVGSESRVLEHLIAAIEKELLADVEGGEASATLLHGHLLAIGQFFHLQKSGSFRDPQKLISSVLIPCLKFDQIRGLYAIGSFVRDAACYVAWSLSRCQSVRYTPNHLECLQKALIFLALFDREVGCRRAAAAALQELLGRQQGGPIEVLSVLHFSSVASLEVSFQKNMLEILKIIPEYWKEDMFAHLLHVTLKNFDVKVRELGAQAISKCCLTPQALHYAYHHSAEDIIHRHGIILALAFLKDQSATTIAKDALKIPPKSLGFDLLLGAYLELITTLSFDADWLVVLGMAFKSKNDQIRMKAVECLSQQSVGNPQEFDDFFTKCLSGVEKERDAAAQRGCLAALSAIPLALWGQLETSILSVLIRAAKQTRPLNDIERRCEALRALERLLKRVELSETVSLQEAFEDGSLLADYSVDMRGDVGSLVRESAMACFKVSKVNLTPTIKNHLLEQAFGRIERLRMIARELIPSFESDSFEEGAMRGLVYTAGGLDADLSKEAIGMIRAAVLGRESVVVDCLLSGLREDKGRLQMPSVITITAVIDLLSVEVLKNVFEFLKESFIPKCTNIRKLLTVFRLLKVMHIDGVQEYLLLQSQEHPYPAIRQLIQDQ